MKKLVIALAAAAALTVSGPRGRYGRQGSAAGCSGCLRADLDWLLCGRRRRIRFVRHRDTQLTVAGLPINRSAGSGWSGLDRNASAGCDYQFPIGANQFVVGAFADYNFSNMRGDFTGHGGRVGLESNTEKIDWYWAVGARIGYLVNPQTLTYFSWWLHSGSSHRLR